jgi:4-oxalocrotonate tautomerase
MPLIQCHIKRGLSDAQKHTLMRELAHATHSALDVDPAHVNVVVLEHDASTLKEIDYTYADPGRS